MPHESCIGHKPPSDSSGCNPSQSNASSTSTGPWCGKEIMPDQLLVQQHRPRTRRRLRMRPPLNTVKDLSRDRHHASLYSQSSWVPWFVGIRGGGKLSFAFPLSKTTDIDLTHSCGRLILTWWLDQAASLCKLQQWNDATINQTSWALKWENSISYHTSIFVMMQNSHWIGQIQDNPMQTQLHCQCKKPTTPQSLNNQLIIICLEAVMESLAVWRMWWSEVVDTRQSAQPHLNTFENNHKYI